MSIFCICTVYTGFVYAYLTQVSLNCSSTYLSSTALPCACNYLVSSDEHSAHLKGKEITDVLFVSVKFTMKTDSRSGRLV